MYQQDWILRQINDLVKMIGKIVFNREEIRYELTEGSLYSETDLLYREILDLLRTYKINEAENLLFSSIKKENLGYLKIALDFYERLNKLSDLELEEGNFTRKEIKEGIQDVLEVYDIDLHKLQ